MIAAAALTIAPPGRGRTRQRAPRGPPTPITTPPQTALDDTGTEPTPTAQNTQITTGPATDRGDHGDTDRATKAKLRVLGTPRIEDITRPGRPLRAKAAELAVFLACHPDGADTRQVGRHLEVGVPGRSADQRVHTNASNLRHVLGRAGGFHNIGYVTKTAGRYRLDPTTVDIDLWQLRDLLNRATIATAPTRTHLLHQACDLATAPLADGCDYDWIEPHREKARRWTTEAHLLLADELLTTNPQAASNLLNKAIGLDHYNEELYRKAMHARHHLHDSDGIRILMTALTKALADLDVEPAEDTIRLAAELREDITRR